MEDNTASSILGMIPAVGSAAAGVYNILNNTAGKAQDQQYRQHVS